jgi:hypothetical protein
MSKRIIKYKSIDGSSGKRKIIMADSKFFHIYKDKYLTYINNNYYYTLYKGNIDYMFYNHNYRQYQKFFILLNNFNDKVLLIDNINNNVKNENNLLEVHKLMSNTFNNIEPIFQEKSGGQFICHVSPYKLYEL